MCGIVCFVGRSNGVDHVLDALQLLEYRAPDSAGLAVPGADGQLVVRRCVGTGRELRAAIAADPLPLPAGQAQIVVGHGRWAMVGAATVENAHPISDRSRGRVVVENGSHNASLMLGVWAEQEAWWRARAATDPIHYTQNTTEVLVYEWERLSYLLAEATPPPGSDDFLARLDRHNVVDLEERALRLAMWRLRAGNAHACAFYSRFRPGRLYVTSHNKPISISIRNNNGRRELMVASDVNAALMLWPKAEVDAAAVQIEQARAAGATRAEVQAILKPYTTEVIFLDHTTCQGQELFARIDNDEEGPTLYLSRYDGTPLAIPSRPLQLNPALADRRGFPSYTESHVAEIPAVIDDVVATYAGNADGRVAMGGVWQDGELVGVGLNVARLQELFGAGLARLHRLLLIGEGSSWRDAQAAAPLLRHLMPGVLVNVYRPVEMLNLGHAAGAAHDLAIEISWSGTTDSLLKVDAWLAELGVTRLAVTGRPQSDLARRTARSGGVLDVRSGIEVSVATVKGYQAILMTLNLLALQLAQLISGQGTVSSEQLVVGSEQLTVTGQVLAELALVVPRHVRAVIEDQERRGQIRRLAARCGRFNKVVVVGNSPVDLEAELKIEEVAQVVALALDFHAASLRPLIERSAMAGDERQRALFIVNATSVAARRAARPILAYLRALDVFHVIHTTPGPVAGAAAPYLTASAGSNYELFVSPEVSPYLQPLVDAPFFFDLAIALAYARGLTPAQIDRPRNLAKSVTTTGAERRADVEVRPEFSNVSLTRFAAARAFTLPPPAALPITMALQAATAILNEPLPPELELAQHDHLVIVADTEATENGANAAAAIWQEVAGISVVVYRRFLDQGPALPPATALLQLVRAGAVLAIHDGQTVALPEAMTPLELELLTAMYLSGLAIRLARPADGGAGAWEKGLAQLPPIVASVLADERVAQSVRRALSPFIGEGYDKVQIIGGGQDFIAAMSIARSLRLHGFVAEALYTDSAWHGPLAAVGGPGADYDALIVILATDPLFQAAALVDTQVYRSRRAPVVLVVPQGNETLGAVRQVDASAIVAVPAVPRPFVPMINAALGDVIAQQMARHESGSSRRRQPLPVAPPG